MRVLADQPRRWRAAIVTVLIGAGAAVLFAVFAGDAQDVSLQLVPVYSDYSQSPPNELYIEGNNPLLREKPAGFEGEWTSTDVAQRWRALAASARGVFVLRDSLYSQQDHVLRKTPYSLMLPPSWIHAAISTSSPSPLKFIDIADDSAWVRLASPDELFGSFPVSTPLFRNATRREKGASPDGRAATVNARLSLNVLAEFSRELVAIARNDRSAAIQFGADRISSGDRAYFTPELRRRKVIPILVENPLPYEIREGKGIIDPGRPISPSDYRELITRICRTRLRDGDIALERYDLSNSRDIERALELLEWIIPKGDEGASAVWLWVTGRLSDDSSLKGENALEYVPSFLEKVAQRRIESDRVRLLLKPAVSPGSAIQREFLRRDLGPSVFLSVDFR